MLLQKHLAGKWNTDSCGFSYPTYRYRVLMQLRQLQSYEGTYKYAQIVKGDAWYSWVPRLYACSTLLSQPVYSTSSCSILNVKYHTTGMVPQITMKQPDSVKNYLKNPGFRPSRGSWTVPLSLSTICTPFSVDCSVDTTVNTEGRANCGLHVPWCKGANVSGIWCSVRPLPFPCPNWFSWAPLPFITHS